MKQIQIMKYINGYLNVEPVYDQMICYAKFRKDNFNSRSKSVSLKDLSKGKLKY